MHGKVLLKVLGAVVGLILGGVLLYALAMTISKLFIASSIGLTKEAGKTIFKVGGFWGNTTANGISSIFSTIWKGFTSIFTRK